MKIRFLYLSEPIVCKLYDIYEKSLPKFNRRPLHIIQMKQLSKELYRQSEDLATFTYDLYSWNMTSRFNVTMLWTVLTLRSVIQELDILTVMSLH